MVETTFHLLLYRAFHTQRGFLRPCLERIGLGPGQPKVVDYLREHGPCRQRELADYFEVDPAAVSRMVEALQKGGFVVRRADQGSRRGDLLELTPRGVEAAHAWEDRCREAEERMLRGFSSEERERFADYLDRAYRNLKEGKEEDPWRT